MRRNTQCAIVRPSHKELTGKICAARAILSSNGFYPVNLQKLTANFVRLELFSQEEQAEALSAALSEVTPRNYTGARPPEKSYEMMVLDDELFAFSWVSPYFKKKMYLKFCVHKEADEVDSLYVASLHEDNPRPRDRK